VEDFGEIVTALITNKLALAEQASMPPVLASGFKPKHEARLLRHLHSLKIWAKAARPFVQQLDFGI
jgi:hypothetical protein